jgi:hypothetical protein
MSLMRLPIAERRGPTGCGEAIDSNAHFGERDFTKPQSAEPRRAGERGAL